IEQDHGASIECQQARWPAPGPRVKRPHKDIKISLYPTCSSAALPLYNAGSFMPAWPLSAREALPPRRFRPSQARERRPMSTKDYIVKDIGLADFGRKELSIAES